MLHFEDAELSLPGSVCLHTKFGGLGWFSPNNARSQVLTLSDWWFRILTLLARYKE